MSDSVTSSDASRRLKALAQPETQQGIQSDAELLALYVEGGQREALEAIVRRYGPMVASVCRLTIADPASAEDAFQATFLVLIKSAKRIRKHASLGAWLHGVAYRTASRLRKQKYRERCSPSGDEEMVEPLHGDCVDPVAQLARKMELEALDRELENLPERLRVPMVEHYLFGHSAPQIAERLELSTAAIEGRLKRGRRKLRIMLARRGISLSVLVAGSTLFRQHVQAGESVDWTNTFVAQHLQDPSSHDATDLAGSTQSQAANGESIGAHSPQVSRLVNREIFMFGRSVSTLQMVLTACVLLVCGALGVLAALPQQSGQRSRLNADRAQDGELVMSPSVLAQAISPQFYPTPGESGSTRPTGAQGAAQTQDNLSSNQPSNAGQGQIGASGSGGLSMSGGGFVEAPAPHVVPWQRPEHEGNEEPTWLAGGRSSMQALERNRKVLAQELQFEFVQIPISGVVAWLNDQGLAQFELNRTELDLLGVSEDEPITVRGQGSIRELIRRAFEHLELTYRVTESTIEITSVQAAAQSQNMRFYDLSYILPNSAYAQEVVSAIEQSVEPDTWLNNGGGNSSIAMVGSTMIVNAPDATHQSIEILLLNLSEMNPLNTEQPVPAIPSRGGFGLGGGGMF